MTRNPTIARVSFKDLIHQYGAKYFPDILGDFLACLQHPDVSERGVRAHGVNTLIPFHNVPVFHKIKFVLDAEIIDTIHIRPEQVDGHGRIMPSRFDTVLVQDHQHLNTVHRKGEF